MDPKRICYAYATSTIADEMDAPGGCYFIQISKYVDWKNRDERGPFETIKDAEETADAMPNPWCSVYKRRPMRGSRFESVKA